MPLNPNVEVEIEGLEPIILHLRRMEAAAEYDTQGLLRRGAYDAAASLRIYVRFDTGRTFRHIDHSHVTPRSTEAHRGWQAVAGIHPIEDGNVDPKYPIYVAKGTGERGPRHMLIYSHQPHGLMTFQKLGEPRRFVRWTRGQHPQPFLYQAFQQTLLYMQGEVPRLGQNILGEHRE